MGIYTAAMVGVITIQFRFHRLAMATYKPNNKMSTHDDYMTPFSAWESIAEYLPKDKVIWECFYGSGESGDHLRELLGCPVIHEDIDFFTEDRGEVLVSNPPFSIKKAVFARLKALGKPFVMICPAAMMATQYLRRHFADELQVIVPQRRIHYVKHVNGKPVANHEKMRCSFDSYFYCWKMGLPRDLVFLQDTKGKRKVAGKKRKREVVAEAVDLTHSPVPAHRTKIARRKTCVRNTPSFTRRIVYKPYKGAPWVVEK